MKRDSVRLEDQGKEMQDGAQVSEVYDWVASFTTRGILTGKKIQ